MLELWLFFLIQILIYLIAREPNFIKKLRTGELQNSKHASSLKKCTILANIPISVSNYKTLNTSTRFASESDLIYVTENEILQNLKEKNIMVVSIIKYHKDNKEIRTKNMILEQSIESESNVFSMNIMCIVIENIKICV